MRLAGCQPSRTVALLLQALADAELEDAEEVMFSPSPVDTRSVEPDPGLHQAGSLRRMRPWSWSRGPNPALPAGRRSPSR
ncbi:hypothetical protein [Candidatus Palauibacter sp.]|uniref:hypothetical protein n=1 Tax=Candidatus Palauibacter sp. TaxID=3101350 RepID=UPI003B5C23D4